MNTDILERMDVIAEKCGSRDPDELANYLHAYIKDIHSNQLIAFVFHSSGILCVGLNAKLPLSIKSVVLMHEVTHIVAHMDFLDICGDMYNENSFGQIFRSREIARQEYEANLVAADFCLPTDEVLEMLGYNLRSLQEYLKYLENFKKHCAEYDAFVGNTIFTTNDRYTQKRLLNWKKRLRAWEEELEDMQRDLTCYNDIMTVEEVAKFYEVPQTIVEYKVEALRQRGYVVGNVELATYGQVFR